MTTTGKVFAILNVIAAGLFIYLTAPVALYRYERQKEIVDTEAATAKIKEEAAALDQDRVVTLEQIAREEAEVNFLKSLGSQQRRVSERQIAEATDDLNHERQVLANIREALASINTEIENRTKEIAELETELEKLNETYVTRSAEVSDLERRLTDATAALAKYRDSMNTNMKKLLAAEESQDRKTSNLAGGGGGSNLLSPVGP